jgi:hypothetical protein
VGLDGQSVFDLDLASDLDPAANRAGCSIVTRDADGWHSRLEAVRLPVTPIEDQPWGMRSG